MSPEVHEHWFFDHEDPRYLFCDCGQYAVRTRNNAGERTFRLIDTPRPVLGPRIVPAPVKRDVELHAPDSDLSEIAV
jgi:hypothetical protein